MFKLDLAGSRDVARKGLLDDAIFPSHTADNEDNNSPDLMKEKDPLSMQIWRLYTRTKAQLPNQERMENLTWRMMAMNLKRKEMQTDLFSSPSSTAASSLK